MSTSKPDARRKSAPNKARSTCATTKVHLNNSPQITNWSVLVPYADMIVPLAALRGCDGGLESLSLYVTGTTLTSAPVSMRKFLSFNVSLTKHNALISPAPDFTESRLARFPLHSSCKVGCTCELCLQTLRGRSTFQNLSCP